MVSSRSTHHSPSFGKIPIYYPLKLSSLMQNQFPSVMTQLKFSSGAGMNSKDFFFHVQPLKHPKLVDSSVTGPLNDRIVFFVVYTI